MSAPTWFSSPQCAQQPSASVISWPKASINKPPIALPSTCASSAISPSSRAESLGPDVSWLVPERDQARGDRFDEAGRPTRERPRLLVGRPGDLGQHDLID